MSEICQKRVEQNITESVTKTFPYQDNIFIIGETLEQHDKNLIETMNNVEKSGATLNYDKCNFRKETITFLGEKLSQNGIEPDPDKIRAIENWETPYDKKSLQSFFGMLNFVGKFVPNMAARTPALRSLLRKEAT